MHSKSPAVAALKAAFPHTIPIFAGFLFLGMTYGVYMRTSGFSFWYPMIMSVVIFGGSLEFVATSMLLAPFAPVQVFLTAVMIQARHLFYGISMMKRYKNTGAAKPYLIFALTDETYSVVCSGDAPEGVDQSRYFFWVSLLDQFYWVVGCVAGALLGSVLPFDTTGIDFSMTALFLVVMTEQWKASRDHTPALVGLGVSLVCLLIFGSSNFLIPSMLGITAALTLLRKVTEKKEADHAV